MKHVFISYVREDSSEVDRIKNSLEQCGVRVWLDRESLAPGQRWKHGIREAIKNGAFFIACFSENSRRRDSTYMNEELTVAVEQLRMKPHETSWFIPIRLSDCEIPTRTIGAGEFLSDFQRVDIFQDFKEGINRLSRLIVPAIAPREYLAVTFERILRYHIDSKITHFTKLKAPRFRQIEDRWEALLERETLDLLFITFFELHERAKYTGKHEFDIIVEQSGHKRFIMLSVVPHQNIHLLLESLEAEKIVTGHKYSDFVINHKRELRKYHDWYKRDFVHIIYFIGEAEVQLDILYLLDPLSAFSLLGYMIEKMGLPKENGGIFTIEGMYPTCLMSAPEANKMINNLLLEEAQLLHPDIDDRMA